MKDKQKAMALGLKKLKPQDCLGCHQSKPSHSLLGRPAFDFPTFWKKIAHGRQKDSESKPVVDYGGM